MKKLWFSLISFCLVLSLCGADGRPILFARQQISPSQESDGGGEDGGGKAFYYRQFIGPVGLGGGGEDITNFTEDASKLIYNPNVGLVSNDAATGSSQTNPNGYPITIMEGRYYWRNLEGTRDAYVWTTLQANAVSARADLQTMNVRLPYLGNVGDCTSTQSDPTWMTDADLSGWTATHDECGTTLNYMNFEDADVRTEFVELLTAAEAAMSTYPAWRHGFLETGYGAYGENNYSGTICATSVNSPDLCSPGSEIPQYTIGEISPWWDLVLGISTSIRKMNMVDNEDLFDYIYDTYSSTAAGGTRGDCWGWREVAPASCPDLFMCDIYSETFGVTSGSGDTPTHPDVDEGGMIFLESCNTVTNWEANSWDFDASFDWALTNGASALNVKGFYNGGASIDTVMTETLRTLGYRYFLDEIRNDSAVTAGNNLSIEIDVTNRGVAPDYDGMVWLVKLVEQGGGAADVYQYTTAETLKIAAGASITDTLTVPIPTWLDQADYDIYVGAGFNDNPGAHDFPELEFAVTAAPLDRWYQAGVVTVTNAGPTANDPIDYAADFDNAGADQLSLADNASISIPSVDFSVAARVKADTLNGFVIAAKGDVGATGQEWSLYTDGSNGQRFTFRISTGTNRTVAATTFGIPSTGTWYCLYADFDATNTILRISVNDGALDSLDTTGTITDKANTLVIGGDTVAGRQWNGQIDDLYFWKGRRLSDTEQSEICSTAGDIKQVQEMNYLTRRGLTVAVEFEENGASYVDDFQHWPYTENGTVTRVDE
jgi:hypothetical protein